MVRLPSRSLPSPLSPLLCRPPLFCHRPIAPFPRPRQSSQSGGQLPLFAEGLRAYKALRGKGSEARVLIAEACNHNRITDTCNDIGMVQLPDQLRAHIGDGVQIDHAFGREFPDLANGECLRTPSPPSDSVHPRALRSHPPLQHRLRSLIPHSFASNSPHAGLGNYDLVLHCGACMIDHQKVRARLSDLRDAGVPVTNYGLLLAWGHHGDDALARVLAPWGVSL